MAGGVGKCFTLKVKGRKFIGCVVMLQIDVIEDRLEHEYKDKCRYEGIQLSKACWIESDNKEQLEDFMKRKYTYMAVDKHGRNVFLADSPYSLQMAQEKFTDIRFYFTSEF